VIFQNPIAWLGLAAIAVPILVHLLGRRRARRLPFPTLRFVPASPLPPVRRDRLTDVALLVVRAAIVGLAAVALVQPLWLTASRAREVGGTSSRAIVVDTSASMERRTPEGERAADRARREAQALAAGATTRVIEAASPAEALPGALAWLAGQSGRTEIVVVSDFQPGAIERADLDRVPADTGVRLIAIPVAAAAPALPAAVSPLRVFVGAAEQRRADAAMSAARQIDGDWKGRGDRPVAIVFAGASERAALVASAQPVDRAWMFDAIAAIGRDDTLNEASSREPRAASLEAPGELTTVIRGADGQPVVLAARGQVDGADRLLLFVQTDAGSVTSAALIAAAGRAATALPPAGEVDPAVRTDAELRSWERPPADGVRPATDPAGRSDGRWIWLAVLALLALEMVMRRAPRAALIEEHRRVA
jgi:hypothetical protein